MPSEIARSMVNFGALTRAAAIAATNQVHVRFGSKADIRAAKSHVRFTPNSNTHRVEITPRPAGFNGCFETGSAVFSSLSIPNRDRLI
jgi:hypothetical protein